MFRVDGRTALVTGASRGLGKSIAILLAQAGAKVALTARNVELLHETAGVIQAAGGEALVLPADLREAATCRELVEAVRARWGRLDILVNNAGVGAAGPIDSVTEAQWDDILDTNLKAMFLLSQAAAPLMREQRWGRIVNISSIAAQTGGVSGAVAYSASKGGALAFTKSLARDLAPYGITVNAITPGQIQTDMGSVSPDRLPEILRLIPLGRLGVPEDIAYPTLFLCSEEAGYITGATLDVNGGILKR
jgi:3-oxoacyl-[acyl-carrier protein] reductase